MKRYNKKVISHQKAIPFQLKKLNFHMYEESSTYKQSVSTHQLTRHAYKYIHFRKVNRNIKSSIFSIEHPQGTMERSITQHVLKVLPTRSTRGLLSSEPHQPNHSKIREVERVSSFAISIRDHVSLGPKITKIVKGKLSLGAKILQLGGVSKIFRQHFSTLDGEKLLQVSQCYLSTTAGPIAGLLFISTEKIAFCSETSIRTYTPTGELLMFRYKVSIPLSKIKGVGESKNMKRPSKKYLQIVTVDNFDFWFMGFINYQKTLRYIHQASFLSS